jgi:hypothetical protein
MEVNRELERLKAPEPPVWIDLTAHSGDVVDVSIQDGKDGAQLVILVGDLALNYATTSYRDVFFINGNQVRFYIRTKLLRLNFHSITTSTMYLNGWRCIHSTGFYKCKDVVVVGDGAGTSREVGRYIIEQSQFMAVSDHLTTELVVYASANLHLNNNRVIGLIPESCVIRSGGAKAGTSYPCMNNSFSTAYLVQLDQNKTEELQTGAPFVW